MELTCVWRDVSGWLRSTLISVTELLQEFFEVNKMSLTHNGKPHCINTDRQTVGNLFVHCQKKQTYEFSSSCARFRTLRTTCTSVVWCSSCRPDMFPTPARVLKARRLCLCGNAAEQCRGWCSWGLKGRSDPQPPSKYSEYLKFYKVLPRWRSDWVVFPQCFISCCGCVAFIFAFAVCKMQRWQVTKYKCSPTVLEYIFFVAENVMLHK